MKKRIKITGPMMVLLILVSQLLTAQPLFTSKANLPAVSTNQFYKLSLTPAILAGCNSSISDIRIKDGKGNEVPFITYRQLPKQQQVLEEFSIESKAVKADKKMHVVVKNNGKFLDELVLLIQNSEATRMVDINGSNDGNQWYSIKENVAVNSYEQTSAGSYELRVNFPPVNYAFFEIAFTNKEVLPINILKAGTYAYSTTNALYDTVSAVSVVQKDSNKISYITVTWDAAYPVEQVNFSINGPALYRRNVQFAGTQINQYATAEFVLQSNKPGWFNVQSKCKTLYFNILNDDSPPLQVKNITGTIEKQYLYAWLEKDKTYSLYFGNQSMAAPVYDLDFFKEMIVKDAADVAILPVEKIPVQAVETAKPADKKIWIWVSISAVLLLLLFFTIKLTKEVNAKKNSAGG